MKFKSLLWLQVLFFFYNVNFLSAKELNLKNFPETSRLGFIDEIQYEFVVRHRGHEYPDFLWLSKNEKTKIKSLFLAIPTEFFYKSTRGFIKQTPLLGEGPGVSNYIYFDDESESVFYESKIGKKYFVVLNGRASKGFDLLSSPQNLSRSLSPDGKNLIFQACNNIGQGSLLLGWKYQCYFVLMNEKEEQLFPLKNYLIEKEKDKPSHDIGQFSPDGKQFYFDVDSKLVWNGKLEKPYRYESWNRNEELIFNKEGNLGLYVGTWQNKKQVVLNGKEASALYDEIWGTHFDDQNNWWAFSKKDEVYFRLKNGEEIEKYSERPKTEIKTANALSETQPFHFREEKKQLEGKTESIIYIDNKKYGPLKEAMTRVIFSPDKKRWALGVEYFKSNKENKSKKDYFIVDGKKEEDFDEVNSFSFQFSPDSKHYTYNAQNGEAGTRKIYRMLDGKKEEKIRNENVKKYLVSEHSFFHPSSGELMTWKIYDEEVPCDVKDPEYIRESKKYVIPGCILHHSEIHYGENKKLKVGYIIPQQKLQFSEDGKKIAYLSMVGKNEIWWVVEVLE